MQKNTFPFWNMCHFHFILHTFCFLWKMNSIWTFFFCSCSCSRTIFPLQWNRNNGDFLVLKKLVVRWLQRPPMTWLHVTTNVTSHNIPAVIAKSMSSIEISGNENNHMNIEIRLFRQLNANEMISCVAVLDLRKRIFFSVTLIFPIGPTHVFSLSWTNQRRPTHSNRAVAPLVDFYI